MQVLASVNGPKSTIWDSEIIVEQQVTIFVPTMAIPILGLGARKLQQDILGAAVIQVDIVASAK